MSGQDARHLKHGQGVCLWAYRYKHEHTEIMLESGASW